MYVAAATAVAGFAEASPDNRSSCGGVRMAVAGVAGVAVCAGVKDAGNRIGKAFGENARCLKELVVTIG